MGICVSSGFYAFLPYVRVFFSLSAGGLSIPSQDFD